MKKLILIILVVAAHKLNAQNHWFGVKVGATNTDISANSFVMEHGPKNGMMAGFTYDYMWNEQLSLGASLLYEERGFTSEFLFTDNIGSVYGKYITSFEYNYLSLPISAGYHIGDKLNCFIDIAAVPSYLLAANYIFPAFNSNGEMIGDEIIDAESEVNKFDLAGKAEIGAGYKILSNLNLYASFTYQQSFTTTSNKDNLLTEGMKHYGSMISVGAKYKLKSRNKE